MNSRRQTGFVVVALLLGAMPALSADLTKQALFKIERSKNANIVQYDALLESDGTINKKKPVTAYWIRPGKADPIKQLSFIQRRFAYGFDASLDRGTDTITLDMVADIGRNIMVRREGAAYVATMQIDGAESYIEKLYIRSVGKGMSTKVEYIDLHGRDLASGDDRYERIRL